MNQARTWGRQEIYACAGIIHNQLKNSPLCLLVRISIEVKAFHRGKGNQVSVYIVNTKARTADEPLLDENQDLITTVEITITTETERAQSVSLVKQEELVYSIVRHLFKQPPGNFPHLVYPNQNEPPRLWLNQHATASNLKSCYSNF